MIWVDDIVVEVFDGRTIQDVERKGSCQGVEDEGTMLVSVDELAQIRRANV